jgi:hypothetical protein
LRSIRRERLVHSQVRRGRSSRPSDACCGIRLAPEAASCTRRQPINR